MVKQGSRGSRSDSLRPQGDAELRQVVLEVACALAELVDRHRPLFERGGHGWIDDADAFQDRVDDALPVDRERDRLADAYVAERLLVGAHRDVGPDVRHELRRSEVGAPLLEDILDLHPVRPADRTGKLPADIVLTGEERRNA